MNPRRIRLSGTALTCLLSVFLIAAGFSRYLETDSGNILIHDIETESWEGFFYGARLFRPLQANSLNQRPSVLLIPGRTADRYTCDHIAMEFARRGFVALTMEDFAQGMTASEPDFETENLVDAGYTFLNTRSFTDHERIGIIAFYEGADKALDSKAFPEYRSRAFVEPKVSAAEKAANNTEIYTAKFETSAEYRLPSDTDQIRVIPASHAGMIVSSDLIGALLEQFHEALAIPNDSPFWFNAGSQRAGLLIGIRFALLILLTVLCVGLSAILTEGKGNAVRETAAGTVLPLVLFLVITEVMSFFMVSVRIGTPFHYLPGIRQIVKQFSLPVFIAFLTVSIFLCIPLRRNRRPLFPADIIALAGVIIFITGALMVMSGKITGQGFDSRIFSHRMLHLTVFYSCLSSLLLRTVPDRKISYFCFAVITGSIYYLSSYPF